MLSTRTVTAVVVWAIAGMMGTGLFLYATPFLEARYAPVLVDQKVQVDDDDRTSGQMCWTWSWVKQRYAQPIALSWSITVDGTAVEFPAVTIRQRDGEVVRSPATAAALGPGSNDLCTKIPQDIDGLKGIVIRGQINYRMPHGLWTVWQELPVVRVPPWPG